MEFYSRGVSKEIIEKTLGLWLLRVYQFLANVSY
jgi:hypothetical protein